MTETTASASSLMQINNNTDTPHTAECWQGSNLPWQSMTLDQFLEHLAERNGETWVFANGQRYTGNPFLDPSAQLTDAVWETIDTVHIFPAMVGGPLPEEEST